MEIIDTNMSINSVMMIMLYNGDNTNTAIDNEDEQEHRHETAES